MMQECKFVICCQDGYLYPVQGKLEHDPINCFITITCRAPAGHMYITCPVSWAPHVWPGNVLK